MRSLDSSELKRIESLLARATARANASSSAGAPIISFVYRPGAPSGGNVYSSWPALMVAVSSIAGTKFIVIDDSLAPATVPAGTWALDDCIFQSNVGPLTGDAQLIFENGATITFARLTLDNAIFICDSSSPIATVGATFAVVFSYFGQITSNAGKAPFFHATSSLFLVCDMATQLGDGVTPVLQVDAPGGLVSVDLSNHSIIEANALTGTGEVDAFFDSDSRIASPQAVATIVRFPQSDAARVAYTPALVANWSGVSPANVATALDRIAAKIGPIA